jgi:hypothetical protein
MSTPKIKRPAPAKKPAPRAKRPTAIRGLTPAEYTMLNDLMIRIGEHNPDAYQLYLGCNMFPGSKPRITLLVKEGIDNGNISMEQSIEFRSSQGE